MSQNTLPVFDGPNFYQGPLSHTHDIQGSFFLYQNPCCNACPSPSAKCNSGDCVPNPQTNSNNDGNGSVLSPLAQRGAKKLGGVNMDEYSKKLAGCASCGPTIANCDKCCDYRGEADKIRDRTSVGVSLENTVCDPDLVFCEFYKKKGHYLNYDKGQPVYQIPAKPFFPESYNNALNGFLPCTFDEHVYDGYCGGNSCSNCGGKGCGSCSGNQPCKYKKSHFLIGIESARNEYELTFSNFALSANGVRQRIIYLIRGKRYYFTFQPCCLSVNPNTGFPTPVCEGGVELACNNVPTVLRDLGLIFTTDPSTRINGPYKGQRLPYVNTSPVRLYDTQWLYIAPNMPATFMIGVGLFSTSFAGADYDGITSLQSNLAGATLTVIVENPDATTIPVF